MIIYLVTQNIKDAFIIFVKNMHYWERQVSEVKQDIIISAGIFFLEEEL